MEPQKDVKTLVALHHDLTNHQCAAEDWAEDYIRNKKIFRQLTDAQSQLELDIFKYFKGLSLRSRSFINEMEYQLRSQKAAEIVLTIDSPEFLNEQTLLVNVLIDGISDVYDAGLAFAEFDTNISLGLTSIDAPIRKAISKDGLRLAKNLTDTSRNVIKQSLQTSLDMGLTVDDAVKRIKDELNNSVRARMIAHTESVNGYNGGILEFGKQSGAKYKQWLVSPNACPICVELAGQRVKVEKQFNSSYIGSIDKPSAHVYCRCTIRLEY